VINYDMALCEMNDEEIKERIAKGKVVKDAGDAQAQVLGTDRHGNVYIHFRQFCGPDLRVYVQKAPKVKYYFFNLFVVVIFDASINLSSTGALSVG